MSTTLYRLNDLNFQPEKHNLYFLFGIKSSATPDEIKSAYRRLTRKYHPDFHNGDKQFQHAFLVINTIYSILHDRRKRLNYDIIYRRKITEMEVTWHYNADDFSEDNYGTIPVGDYRAIIENAEETSSQNTGLPMIKLTLKVNGYNSKLWGYIVLDPDNPKRTNQTLGTVFNSFAITPGNMDIDTWIGRMGPFTSGTNQTITATRALNSATSSTAKIRTSYRSGRVIPAPLPQTILTLIWSTSETVKTCPTRQVSPSRLVPSQLKPRSFGGGASSVFRYGKICGYKNFPISLLERRIWGGSYYEQHVYMPIFYHI